MNFKTSFAALVIMSLLVMAFGTIPVSASSGEPREYSSLGKDKAEFVPDEILVKFKQDNQPFRIIKVPEGKVKEKVAEYSRKPDVEFAEPNYYAEAISIPTDPMYNYQWNFGNPDNGGIGIESAWDISTGLGVTVAVIDTGIAYENYSGYVQAPDLANTNFASGYDFVNNDEHPNDDNSHGTHVAGTIAQSTNNGVGVAGIAYNATIMPIKVLNKRGSGTYANIASGIRWAANNGAKVINMSLGGPVPSTALEDALAYAYNIKGVTIVAAAGNDGAGSVSYPAAYDAYVIAVGATRYDKALASYSNYGSSLDLVAPGGDLNVDQNGDGYGDGILQNTFNPTSKNVSDFGYWFFQGTSMASPHVAGVAALVISHGNASTPAEVRSALQETARDLGASGKDNTYGYGLVNASAALNWVGAPNHPPVAYDQSVTTNQDTSVNITLNAADPENSSLTYSCVALPEHGTLSGTAPNLTYTPASGYAGTDSFTFQANDGSLNSNIATVSIVVNPSPTGQTIHVGDIDASQNINSRTGKWSVSVTVTIHNATHGIVPGATVYGTWSGAAKGSVSAITGTNGTVTFTKANLNGPNVTFTVNNVTYNTSIYNATDNHDPDADSNGTTITVNKP